MFNKKFKVVNLIQKLKKVTFINKFVCSFKILPEKKG